MLGYGNSIFFFSSRRRHTRYIGYWSSDVCSSDLIEDNPANLKLVAQILGRRKHIHLLTAHTPEIGIQIASNRKPDLILLDINMPNMNGYQVLEVIKSDNSLMHIPVIAVTANAMLRDIEQGKAAGFTDYVTKPIDVPKFIELIDSCLPGEELA